MAPVHFRPHGHVQLVEGGSDANSFEDEIRRGELGTTREAHEIHANAWPFAAAHKKMWLAVLKRAVQDIVDDETDDLNYDDDGEWIEESAAAHLEAAEQARKWFRADNDDFVNVVLWMGLSEDQARAIATLEPAELIANLRASEKREADLEKKRK